MILQYGVYTDVGRVRDNNEDNFYMNGHFKPMEEPYREVLDVFTYSEEQSELVLAVCDGMGGEEAGEMASYAAVSNLKDYIGPFSTWYEQYIDYTNRCIWEIQKGRGNSGTTLAAIGIENGQMFSVNLGDSRVYVLRDEKLYQISVDHNEFEMLRRAGLLEDEDYYSNKHRNALTRSLGMPEEYGKVEPHVSELVELAPGDIYMICSDGVCGTLREEEIVSILLSGGDALEKSKELVFAAFENGSTDNATALVCEVYE